ncbi:MAG: hypothetical protein V2I37_10665 [Marinilabiliaceae bacterium]|jgi:hypothetical protein|nr:hypothetical protein [Marinilabiliaceae bacterium]
MKKPLLITIIILIVLLFLPAVGFFGWFFKEKKPMDIVIMDKTVHSLDRLNHRLLTWVLANDRIVKKDNKQKYLLRKDYYGFYPIKPLRSKQFRMNDLRLNDVIIMAESNDVLYYADTYGVFFNDWYQGMHRNRRTRKLYGGLNNNDYLLLVEMRKRDKLTILEYNTFDYPTDAFERYRVEEGQYNMKSTGWIGEYYPSLDSLSVPPWLISMHAKRYNTPWDFKNAGIVFLKGETEVVILEEGKHLNTAMPFIITDPSLAAEYGVAEKVPFLGAFDIVDPRENNVVSSFELDVTEEGADILDRRLMISPRIPAVIRDNTSGNAVYFCGDFATGQIPPWTACFSNLKFIDGLLYKDDDINDPRRFFWLYYRPLLGTILGDYYNSLDN